MFASLAADASIFNHVTDVLDIPVQHTAHQSPRNSHPAGMQRASVGSNHHSDLKLRNRGRQCKLRYDEMLRRRPGVRDHVQRLEAGVSHTSVTRRRSSDLQPRLTAQTLAVLLRGQAFRGITRDTFLVEERSKMERVAAQARCLESLMQRLIGPFEDSGHRVDVFLTLYRQLGGPLQKLLNPLGSRVVSIATIEQDSTPSQLLPLASAVRAFLGWCADQATRYAAVIVTRFDLYLKMDMHHLLGDAAGVDGFRFLFRESGGHWRHHSDRATTNRTFRLSRRGNWKLRNPRAPDALIAFPFAYTRCFLGAVRNELFPLRNESRPLSFLHNMIPGLIQALPEADAESPLDVQPRYRYLVDGQYDSNPCRSTCMLNPIYDIEPRMSWVTNSRICQRIEDFQYDKVHDACLAQL